MCSHYEELAEMDKYRAAWGVDPPSQRKLDLWPGYKGSFIRKHRHADAGDEAVPQREALLGVFGMIPHWAKDMKLARQTYNARSETVAEKPSFRDAWRKGQRCIVPAKAIFEPDHRSGKAVPTRILRADGQPMGIAGLWSEWRADTGEIVHNYTMLTINADEHELMKQFHKPTDEKRMVVILPEHAYEDWLNAEVKNQREFLVQFPAQELVAEVPGGKGELF